MYVRLVTVFSGLHVHSVIDSVWWLACTVRSVSDSVWWFECTFGQ